jgi:glycosyltransferase involved in cell wall biosynthesis
VRILKVSRCYYPALAYGGPVRKMMALAGGLRSRGHEVTVYASNLGSPGRKLSCGTTEEIVDGCRAVYFDAALTWRWEAVTPDLAHYCRRELGAFDLVHLYGYRDFLTTLTGWYAHRMGLPIVFEPMGMYRPLVSSILAKSVYDRLVGRRLAGWARWVVATSDLERRELVGSGLTPDRVVVRRNGLDPASLEVAGTAGCEGPLHENEVTLLYLGRLARKKGLDLLLRALSGLTASSWRLIVAGPDDDGTAGRVRKLAHRLGLSGRLILTGPVYGRDRAGLLASADLVVLPSRNENFGNVALEAMGSGTPVLVTDRCGVAEIVSRRTPSGKGSFVIGETGLVSSCDAAGIGAALAAAIGDRTRRERFGRVGSEKARKLTWDGPVELMERLYREAIETRKVIPGKAMSGH